MSHFPRLTTRHLRFKQFVTSVFRDHALDPSSIKTTHDADSLASMEANQWLWYKLVVLGVVGICLRDNHFWPELDAILVRIRGHPDFATVVAAASIAILVSYPLHDRVIRIMRHFLIHFFQCTLTSPHHSYLVCSTTTWLLPACGARTAGRQRGDVAPWPRLLIRKNTRLNSWLSWTRCGKNHWRLITASSTLIHTTSKRPFQTASCRNCSRNNLTSSGRFTRSTRFVV